MSLRSLTSLPRESSQPQPTTRNTVSPFYITLKIRTGIGRDCKRITVEAVIQAEGIREAKLASLGYARSLGITAMDEPGASVHCQAYLSDRID